MRTVLILSLLCPAARAQEISDMSVMFGAAGTPAVAVAVTPTQPAAAASRSLGWTCQFALAARFYSTAAGSLYWYFEAPFTFVFGGEVAGVKRNASYVTPGVRFKIPTKTRILFYGVLGGGYAVYNEKDGMIDGQLTAAQESGVTRPAADLGGGIDLRLNHLVSLRADGRDYITPAGLGGSTGHNHPLFAAGIAFHL